MWDSILNFNDTINTFLAYGPEHERWRRVRVDAVLKNESPKPIDDAQARKLKVARFAHVPVDCLEIKTETKEAE